MRLEHDLSFAFSAMWRFLEKWHVALGEGHFWLPPCLGAEGDVKAAAKLLSSPMTGVLKASQNCSPSLDLYCTGFMCLDPKW